MQNDFVPIHLKQANANLDKHVLAEIQEKKDEASHKDKSIWQKFLEMFT